MDEWGEPMRHLQEEIELALDQHNPGLISRIELGRGSEDMDLTANVDVEVTIVDGPTREFAIISADCMRRLCSRSPLSAWAAAPNPDILQWDGPIFVVEGISGDSIVRAVVDYVRRESSEALDGETKPMGQAASPHALYLRDLGHLVKERALEAKEQFGDAADGEARAFADGRRFGLYEMVSLMQEQARAFNLELSDMALDGIDPEGGLR